MVDGNAGQSPQAAPGEGMNFTAASGTGVSRW